MFALGFVSVFDQVLEGLPDGDRENLFKAYLSSLDENPSKYRQVLFFWQPQLSDKPESKIFLHLFCLENTQRRKPLDSCLGASRMEGSFVSTASFCIGCKKAVAPLQGNRLPSDLKAAAKGMDYWSCKSCCKACPALNACEAGSRPS